MKCERCGYENFSESHYCRKCWAELHKLDGEGGDSELSRYKNRGNYQPSYNCKKDLYDGNNRYIRGLYNLDTNNNYTGANSQYSSAQNVPYNNGVNNNQQSQTRQYPETASTQYDNNGYSEDNFSATDSTSYDNSTYNDRQYPETASTQYDNNGYSEDNFSATDNTSYDNSTYNDRQYPETASTQYNNNHYSTPATLSYNKYNDKQDDNMKGDLPFSIYNGYNNSRYSTKAYQAAKAQRNYNYTDSSTAYGEQSVYNKYKKTPYYTDETRERANRSINNFIMVVRLIPILVFAIIYLVVSLYDTGMIVDKKRSNVEASTAVQATQPVIPTAELSGSLNTIINEDGKPFAVSYHPPEEYTFLDNGLDSYALFESNICGKTVSLTTIFFNGNFEEELDYYKKLGERSGTTVEINTYDKDLGNVTDIKISTNGKGISRQLFIEVEKECVVYVSMTNISFEYADEAEKLIELLVEDMWVTYPEEVTTEEVTEAPTE